MPVPLKVLRPTYPTSFDNSVLSTFQRCPRKAFYQYYLHRATKGKNWPIQFGVAYHKFRETLETIYISEVLNGSMELNSETGQAFFEVAWQSALKVEGGFEDPPIDHRKSYLHEARLLQSCEKAFEAWVREKRMGKIVVIAPEQPFELELPSGEKYTGRMDQIVKWSSKVWVRDFKTTTRMGRTYASHFDPNNQMTGYVWGAQELSGYKVEGVIIETLYNTKTTIAEIHQFLSTRTQAQIAEWVEEQSYEIDRIRQYEKDDVYPKRTVACNDYGGCAFRDACSQSHWHSREKWLEANTIESVWDPMNPEDEEGTTD